MIVVVLCFILSVTLLQLEEVARVIPVALDELEAFGVRGGTIWLIPQIFYCSTCMAC